MKSKFTYCFILFLFSVNFCSAQFSENFNDGDFTNNPVWTENKTPGFQINSAFQLQSLSTLASSTFYLSTPNSLATTAEWEFFIKLDFNPSSANYADVFLTASSDNLLASSTTGYFVRIGNTADEISLYRKNNNGTSTVIINGIDGVLNTSSNTIKIKVVRTVDNVWILSRDISGTGNNYVTEGLITDNTFLTSSFFGILITQSTASFHQKHFFDDITIKPYVPDIIPPAIASVKATSANTADVFFSESVSLNTSQNTNNYIANSGVGTASSAIRDAANSALVHLTFSQNFPNGPHVLLNINNVEDLSGNAIINSTAGFSFYIPVQYDVIINEIMADPSPQVGLPNSEWIELKNVSAYPVNLAELKIAKSASLSGEFPDYNLMPGEYAIVCTGSAVADLAAFGNVISVTSFPSLTNEADMLSLRSAENKTIHTVNYSDSWYQNSLKKNGGWTLEMIDGKNPCSGVNNWKASIDPKGGTPGKKNSVDANNPDKNPPELLRAYATDKQNIVLVFNEPADSLSASDISKYSLSDGLVISSATPAGPVFERINIKLAGSVLLDSGKVYFASANAVIDCAGNTSDPQIKVRFGLAGSPDKNEVVINEILFNPAADGADYLELYNTSKKIFDLNKMSVANKNSSNIIGSIYNASAENNLLFPGEYALITTDTTWVLKNYLSNDPKTFIQIATMPSYPDDKGFAILLNVHGEVIDEVDYSEKWHFTLIDNKEGISLERIDFKGSSTESNFHSAATSVGYGTPGIKNSQYHPEQDFPGEITVTPEIFSPDNDGLDDFATLNYSFPAPGYITNITVFDGEGRPVRYLQKNALNGIKGYYRWDGLNEKKQKLPAGIYIIVTEAFNADGKKHLYKNTVVLAKRFN